MRKKKHIKKESASKRLERFQAIYSFEKYRALNDLYERRLSDEELQILLQGWPKEMPDEWVPENSSMSLRQAKRGFGSEWSREQDRLDEEDYELNGDYGLGPNVTPWDFM